EHAPEAGSDVFTQAVSQHSGRPDSPRDPELRQSIFKSEDTGLSVPRLVDQLLRGSLLFGAGVECIAKIEVEVVSCHLGAVVNAPAKNRFGIIQVPAHADVLGSLTRK